MSRRLLRRFTVIGLTALAALTTTATVSLGEPSREFDEYVALGDSYTSGPLIPWLRPEALNCARSTGNYPSLLAARIQPENFLDVSCGGADTEDMLNPQSPLSPAQLNALRPETDLVTLGIGGNDFQTFAEVTNTCAAVRAQDPVGSPCRAHFNADGGSELTRRIAAVEERIVGVIEQIKVRSPEAKIVTVGYPRIIPPTGYCPDIIPFADGDYAFYDEWEPNLNSAVSNAAQRTSATFVDTYTPSLGHDACATGGAAWINGMRFNLFAAPMHPFASAMAAQASLIADTLSGRAPDVAAADRAATEAATAAHAEIKQATPEQVADNREVAHIQGWR